MPSLPERLPIWTPAIAKPREERRESGETEGSRNWRERQKAHRIQTNEKQEEEGRKEKKGHDRTGWMLGEKNVERERERDRVRE